MSDPTQHYGIIELSIVEGLVLVLAFWQLWTVRAYLRRDHKADPPKSWDREPPSEPPAGSNGEDTPPEDD